MDRVVGEALVEVEVDIENHVRREVQSFSRDCGDCAAESSFGFLAKRIFGGEGESVSRGTRGGFPRVEFELVVGCPGRSGC